MIDFNIHGIYNQFFASLFIENVCTCHKHENEFI